MHKTHIYILEILFFITFFAFYFLGTPKGKGWKRISYCLLSVVWLICFAVIACNLYFQLPLFKAIPRGDYDYISNVLNEKPALITRRNILGESILHAAVKSQIPSTVELLICKGADINASDVNHVSPMHIAVDLDNMEIAEILIKNGANLNLRAYRDRFTPLHLAVLNNNFKFVEFLVLSGENIRVKDRKGRTAIELAKEKGYRTIEEYLKNFNMRNPGSDQADLDGLEGTE